MPSADRLEEFVSIVDEGSISSAARALELPRATLSRRLADLETSLGVRLLHRGTRRLVLTPAGEELHRRARRVLADTEAAWASVQRLDDVPRGPLRVSVSDTRVALGDLFVSFAADYPEVRLEVSTSSRHVDLVAEGIDVAVRFGAIHDDSLIARRVWTTRSVVVGSPAYLAAHPEPDDPDALAQHHCIVGFAGESTPARTWPRLDGGTLPISPRFSASAIDLQIAAAERGLGLALIPKSAIEDQLRAGTLRPVLEDTIGTEVPASLVFVDREFLAPRVRLFIERAVEYYRAQNSSLTHLVQ